jgi:hypothetical protein
MTDSRLQANIVAARADGGRIAENILYFARLLRASGLPIGPQKTVLATEAVLAAGVEDAKTLFWTLHSVFVSRRSEAEIFNQAFHLFWRDPGYVQQLMSVMVPNLKREPQRQDAMARRLAESLMTKRAAEAAQTRDELKFEATGTFSGAEVLQSKDFEQMSAEELRLARATLRGMGLAMAEMRTRRFRPSRRSERLDTRAMLRAMGRGGPDALRPMWKARTWRKPPLVVLCDISGSMDVYARVFLHFLYAVSNDRDHVHAFLFGTRLTNVTRALRNRDPDAAIAKASRAAPDWAGGTRIGETLAAFNRLWARRVLGQNATVLVITDGLDRSGGDGVEAAARRLRASCRRLVWLNPLMRYDEYAPMAAGARALSKHVSEARACHNLRSIADLTAALT